MLKEALHPFRKKYHHPFHALKDVSFEVKKGETVGIIGTNGAGKSTLLKILTGVLTPSSGEVQVNGRISSLLELGTGFNPDLTGMENIYFNGTINGFSRKEIDSKVDDIIAFADIGEFINQPVKTYSSGMFVRLAFSCATAINPDILIVDEALSVGDMFFQSKCMSKMKKMIDNNETTLLFVSHDTSTVKALCKKGILLDKGTTIYVGDASVAVEKYFHMKVGSEQLIINKSATTTESTTNNIESKNELNKLFDYNPAFEKIASFQRIQNGKASFKNVLLLDESNNRLETVQFGQKLTLRMAIEIHEDIHLLGYGYHIRDKNGTSVVYSDCIVEGQNCLENLKAGDKFIIDWSFNAALCQGQYHILSAISTPINLELSQVDYSDYIPISYQFIMEPRRPTTIYGFIKWDNKINTLKL